MNTDLLMRGGTGLGEWLWQTTLHATILILLVTLTQEALERWLSPAVRYALSFLVLIRLLLPVSPPSSLSLSNLIAEPASAVQGAHEQRSAYPGDLAGPAKRIESSRAAAPNEEPGRISEFGWCGGWESMGMMGDPGSRKGWGLDTCSPIGGGWRDFLNSHCNREGGL